MARKEHRSSGRLELTRRINERIVIGDDITLLVVDIRGNEVRLGIDAPKEIPVNRAEKVERERKKED